MSSFTLNRSFPRCDMDVPRWFSPPHPHYPSRREFLQRAGNGAGLLALAGLLADETGFASRAAAAEPYVNPLAPRKSHFPAQATSVVWLFMNGGPSQVDTWDYKP